MIRWRRVAAGLVFLMVWIAGVQGAQAAATPAPARSLSMPKGITLPPMTAAREMAQALHNLAVALPHVAADWGTGGAGDPRNVVQAVHDQLGTLLPNVDQEFDQLDRALAAMNAPVSTQGRNSAAIIAIHEGYAHLRPALEDLLRAGSPDEAARLAAPVVKQLMAWEESLQPPALPDQLPIGPLPAGPAVTDATEEKTVALPVTTGKPLSGDLGDPQVIPAAVRSIVGQVGKDPATLAAWVYTHIDSQWYPGAEKGAERTLAEQAGNDADQALLLVGLLRAAGVPAHLVTGHADIALDLLQGELDIPRADLVAPAVAAARSPVQISGKNIVRLPHVWVEAFTGTGWAVLDSSLQRYDLRAPEVDAAGKLAFDLYDYLQRPRDGSPLQQYEGRVGDAIGGIDRALRSRTRDQGDTLAPGQLPPLRFDPRGSAEVVTGLPPASPTVTVDLAGMTYSAPLAVIGIQPISVTYSAASDDGKALAAASTGTVAAPPFLYDLRPELRLGGAVVAQGEPVAAGKAQLLRVTLHTAQGDEVYPRSVLAGGTYGITLSPQGLEQGRAERLIKAAWSLGDSAADPKDPIGTALQSMANQYFALVDGGADRLARWNGYIATRGISAVITALEQRDAVLFGVPVASDWQAVSFDVERVAYTPRDLTGSQGVREKAFLVLVGAEASWAEQKVFGESLQVPAVSTVGVLQQQAVAGQTIEWTCRCAETEATGIPDTDLGPAAQAHIATAYNQGLLIVTPTTTTVAGAWSGEGYVLIDPTTGASGWFLTGGLAGGWADLKEWGEAAWNAAVSAVGKGARLVGNKIVDGLVAIIADAELLQALGLPQEQREAIGRGAVLGLMDGFVEGARGEWQGIKGIVSLVAFCARYSTDPEFAAEAAVKVGEVVTQSPSTSY